MAENEKAGTTTKWSLRRRFFSFPTLASFAIAFVILALLGTRFDIDLSATWDNIKKSNPLLYLLAFACYYTTFFFRGARWRILLKNVGKGDESYPIPPSAWRCSRLILLGWFANTITWFRLGDAYRAYAYNEDTGAGFPRTFGTILAERVLDVATFFGLFLVTAMVLYLAGKANPSPGFLAGAAIMLAAVALILVLMRLLRVHLSRLLPHRLANAYEHFHQGTMGSFRRLPLVAVLSLLGWLSEVGRLHFVLHSLGMSVGGGLVVLVALANALLTTVPVTPGGLGIVEPGIVGLLTLSLSRSEAVAVALVDRSISYLSVVVLGGLVFLLRQGARARAAARATSSRG